MPEKIDLIISYNPNDEAWAEWVAWLLQEAGHTVALTAWDPVESNLAQEMQRAADGCKRIIALLSPHYMAGEFTEPEWAAAFGQDPPSMARVLVPVRIAECEPTGLPPPHVYIDLVGLDRDAAARKLLEGVAQSAPRATLTPSFPRAESKPFPGSRSQGTDPLAATDRPCEATFLRHPESTALLQASNPTPTDDGGDIALAATGVPDEPKAAMGDMARDTHVSPVPSQSIPPAAEDADVPLGSADVERLPEAAPTTPGESEAGAGDANHPTTILFLAADPSDQGRLRLGQELRDIEEELRLSRNRAAFRLVQRMCIQPDDLVRALLEERPDIVHFAGHGTAKGELCIENALGEAHPVSAKALAALFEQFGDTVDCVVLNACYSALQAKAIAQHIRYVVGMDRAIGDKAAIAFAVGFYMALAAGRTVPAAHALGCVQIQLLGIREELTPLLLARERSTGALVSHTLDTVDDAPSHQKDDAALIEYPYVANARSKRLHRATCPSIRRTSAAHRRPLRSREDAIALGYVPCGRCKP